MNVISRAKAIIINPAKEWDTIQTELPYTNKIITTYVIPLAGVAALASFIGYGFIGAGAFGFRVVGLNWGLYQGLSVFITALLSVFITAFVIDALAPSFGSEKNFGRSVQLVAYSLTPAWLGGLLAVIPALGLIGGLFGLYGLYLLYIGLPKLKNTPQDKQMGYFLVSLLVTIAVYVIIGMILGSVLMSAIGLSYAHL